MHDIEYAAYISTVTSKVLVEIPKKIWIKSAMKRDFLRHLREIVECSMKQAGTNSVWAIYSMGGHA